MKRIIFFSLILIFVFKDYLAAIENETVDYENSVPLLSAYEDNYFLLHGFGKPDYDNVSGEYGSRHYNRCVKFQISIKFCLYMAEKVSEGSGLYLAYTQKSIWDLRYGKRSPFLEFNYGPEGFYRFNMSRDFLKYIQIGTKHESNGIGGYQLVDSRSWNMAYGEIKLNLLKEIMNVRLRGWVPYAGDDLPDGSHPADYMGYGELTLGMDFYRKFFRDIFGINSSLDTKLRVSPGEDIEVTKRLTAEVNLKYGPFESLTKKDIIPVAFLFQYFRGYGETLLKLDKFDNHLFRAGISLTLD